ncbi:MAG: hypothetical protein IKF97_05915 [Clostridia bacterium]|nr:hypothetical protein [Clostridia bacterium]MBR3255722.1 hypothetical protein [Clostridia bacterium]
MKIFQKLLILFLVIINISSINYFCKVFAAFADYSDEQAAEDTNKLIEEQKKEEPSIGKSTNNYLEYLEVEGYELTPNFDKQTLEYIVREKIKSEEITIKAKTDDDKAKVEGIGTLKIEQGKEEYRIDVTAESGTVRTYIIKIGNDETISKENSEKNTDIENINSNNLENPNTENVQTEEDKRNNNIIIYTALSIVIALVAIVVIRTKKQNKGKH